MSLNNFLENKCEDKLNSKFMELEQKTVIFHNFQKMIVKTVKKYCILQDGLVKNGIKHIV